MRTLADSSVLIEQNQSLTRHIQWCQELMSGEAAKERVTTVPSKSGLLTYFRFGEAQCASCGLSPTLGHATIASASQRKAPQNGEGFWHHR